MFRPAGFYSDSDEDSEFGYDFGYSKSESVKQIDNKIPPTANTNNDDALYQATVDGNLDEVQLILEADKYLLNGCLRHGWPLLLLACNEAQYAIVEFLLEEKRIDVNQNWGLKTALMAACESTRNSEDVLKLVSLLLEFGAVINCTDSYGMTPLMFAITNGHTEVVKLMIDQASLEATDNEGLTALFHAVNSNQPEVVKLLLKSGASTDIINRRGFTPKQEAEFKGYQEVAQLFPADQDFYTIPNKYLSYNHYRDLCYGETENDMPGYHQEIGLLLFGSYSEQHLGVFAKEGFDLMQYLTLTDSELKDLGFQLPFERKKILFGLLKFHRQTWSKRSMKKFDKDCVLDSYDLFEMLGNHLKHLTVMQASLVYVAQMKSLSGGNAELGSLLTKCQMKLEPMRQAVALLEKEIEKIHRLSTRPVLHIDADTPRNQKKWKGWSTTRVIFIIVISGALTSLVRFLRK
ncbi:ankyrin repeat, SAM and basic leucine zipper domain-containing protein 1 [Malaya genurostris]|uniref:ankyrin repeat, SAM and basic leucine zipper domain-containing protein 1 n=1 Tax=Malaya genurostris TaxID=325434 RepID=UPI0026F3D2B7|nr:ankyrin repeat, SAM and basic leucine zipper domain-containing protein 1 [Malaya genurostris]XP_058460080.1 ankyrin repeat, SAM and basic leucine zipper domain-containing protein 1 [Malaya genurostris]